MSVPSGYSMVMSPGADALAAADAPPANGFVGVSNANFFFFAGRSSTTNADFSTDNQNAKASSGDIGPFIFGPSNFCVAATHASRVITPTCLPRHTTNALFVNTLGLERVGNNSLTVCW